MNISRLKKTFLFLTLINLTGCSAALKQMDLGIPGLSKSDQSTAQNISVEQLLAQARGETSRMESREDSSELLLNFDTATDQLSPQQQERLNRFANLHSNLMQVECALGSQANRFSAASVAISRCTNVSAFLTQRARATEINLRPDLAADVVKVSQ